MELEFSPVWHFQSGARRRERNCPQLNAPEMLFRCKNHFWIFLEESLEEESLIESKMSANPT